MATFNLANKIKIVNPHSNVSEWYGPYNDIATAESTIPEGIRGQGLTVGIIESGIVVEYWWSGTDFTDGNLVRKLPSDVIVSGSNISDLVNDADYLLTVGDNVVSSSIQIDHNATTNYVAGEHFLQSEIITVGTVTTGDVSAILPIGSVSSSIQVDHNATTNYVAGEHFLQSEITEVGTVTTGNVDAILPAGVVSGSITSPSQGTLRVNDVNIDLGLQAADSPQFTNLTVTGDLVVTGDTINANVTNLDIEDRYILLNSGSATIGDSGIVFGGSNGTAQEGAAVIWDASYNSNDGRLAIVNDIASDATGDQTPSYHVAGVFEGTEANAATAQADHVGNIRVEGGDIFIYV
jgi:hypothetical protein